MKNWFPNRASKHKTPASLAFDIHYAKLRVVERWDRERYDRLCLFLQLTRHELASLICWPHGNVDRAVTSNCFRGPVALLLTILEAQVMANLSADIISQPFPTNGQQKTS